MGTGRRRQGCGLLRFKRRRGAADQGYGHRPRATEYPRKLHLSRRHRHGPAARRGATTRGRVQSFSCQFGGTSRENRAGGAVFGQRCIIICYGHGARGRRWRAGGNGLANTINSSIMTTRKINTKVVAKTDKRERSREWHQRAQQSLIEGVNSPSRGAAVYSPGPVVLERGH